VIFKFFENQYQMKKVFLFLLTLLYFNFLNAQSIESKSDFLNGFDTKGTMLYTFNDRYDGIEGNYYFYDTLYHEGELWMTNNRHYTSDYKYKFDQIEGTVQIRYADGKELLLDVNQVLSFAMFIDDKTVNFVKAQLPKAENKRLFQVIYWSSSMKLLRDIKKKAVRTKLKTSFSNNKVVDKIESDYHYYFSRKNDNLVEIKINKKGIIKALPNKEKEIERLFKTKTLKDLTVTKLAELMQKLDTEK
jgi:hypothetical protein